MIERLLWRAVCWYFAEELQMFQDEGYERGFRDGLEYAQNQTVH